MLPTKFSSLVRRPKSLLFARWTGSPSVKGSPEGISLGWFGMVGSLKQCDFSLENQRVADGVWLKAKQTILIAGRKVVSALRYRSTEEEYGFRKP